MPPENESKANLSSHIPFAEAEFGNVNLLMLKRKEFPGSSNSTHNYNELTKRNTYENENVPLDNR